MSTLETIVTMALFLLFVGIGLLDLLDSYTSGRR